MVGSKKDDGQSCGWRVVARAYLDAGLGVPKATIVTIRISQPGFSCHYQCWRCKNRDLTWFNIHIQLYLTIKNKDFYAKLEGFSLVEFAPSWSFGDGMIRQHDVTWEQRSAMNRFGFLRAAGAGHGTSSPATFIHLAHHNAGVARHGHVHGMRPQDAAVHLGEGKRVSSLVYQLKVA